MGILPEVIRSHTSMVSTRLYIHDNILSWNVKGRTMNERTLNEFAAYYKRVIRVERYLKDLIYEKYVEMYGGNAYLHIYNRYLSTLKMRQQANDKTFLKIFKEKKDNLKKLESSIDKMYTSEVIAFFSHKVFLKDKVRKNFFDKSIKTNMNNFRRIAKNYKDFRNCICHYDIKQFKVEKARFIDSLIFFEKIVNCKYRFTSGSLEILEYKPSITSILQYIYNTNPEYFKDDRVLVNVFDDIARLIDFRTDNLPQYKSIIRQKFKIEELL